MNIEDYIKGSINNFLNPKPYKVCICETAKLTGEMNLLRYRHRCECKGWINQYEIFEGRKVLRHDS
jgi:hypothetical protein